MMEAEIDTAEKMPRGIVVECEPWLSRKIKAPLRGAVRHSSSKGMFIEFPKPLRVGSIVLVKLKTAPTEAWASEDNALRTMSLAQVKVCTQPPHPSEDTYLVELNYL